MAALHSAIHDLRVERGAFEEALDLLVVDHAAPRVGSQCSDQHQSAVDIAGAEAAIGFDDDAQAQVGGVSGIEGITECDVEMRAGLGRPIEPQVQLGEVCMADQLRLAEPEAGAHLELGEVVGLRRPICVDRPGGVADQVLDHTEIAASGALEFQIAGLLGKDERFS